MVDDPTTEKTNGKKEKQWELKSTAQPQRV
jgi:hypothetical protein